MAGHPDRRLQIRRKILDGGAVEAVRLRIAQPDPAGLDAEEIGHARECFAGRPLLGRRAVERFGDLLEHPQRACRGETISICDLHVIGYFGSANATR